MQFQRAPRSDEHRRMFYPQLQRLVLVALLVPTLGVFHQIEAAVSQESQIATIQLLLRDSKFSNVMAMLSQLPQVQQRVSELAQSGHQAHANDYSPVSLVDKVALQFLHQLCLDAAQHLSQHVIRACFLYIVQQDQERTAEYVCSLRAPNLNLTGLLLRFLESYSVCLAKERRWDEAVHFGRKACSASEAKAKTLCGDQSHLTAKCIDASLPSSCLMLAIMLRDGSSNEASLAESEAIFGKILATGKQLFAESQQAGTPVSPTAARTACR